VLKPSRLSLARSSRGSTRLQAVLESLVGMLLEGKMQAGLIHGAWGESSLLLGFYMPAPDRPGVPLRRRVTGGPSVVMEPDTPYTGIVFAAESLEETAILGESVARCLGADVWGATRFGPSKLGVGVIEIIGGRPGREAAVRCFEESISSRVETVEIGEPPGAARIERAYRHPGWAGYKGAALMPLRGERSSGAYTVRVGIALSEGRFIADARIDGTFMAAPPNEPFNTLSNVRGMPLGDQALLSLEVRLERIEWYGVAWRTVLDAFLEAAGKAGVNMG